METVQKRISVDSLERLMIAMINVTKYTFKSGPHWTAIPRHYVSQALLILSLSQ
jgi:hypothetical protein